MAVAQILGLAQWSRFCQQVPGRARLDDWRWDGAMGGVIFMQALLQMNEPGFALHSIKYMQCQAQSIKINLNKPF